MPSVSSSLPKRCTTGLSEYKEDRASSACYSMQRLLARTLRVTHWVYYFAVLYSFNVEVSSALNINNRSAYIRASRIYRNLCGAPVLELFTPLSIQLMSSRSRKVHFNLENEANSVVCFFSTENGVENLQLFTVLMLIRTEFHIEFIL